MGTHHQGPIDEINALNSFIKLQRAADSILVRTHAGLPGNLTETQFAVLEALHHLGPLCQGELAEKLLKSGGNLTLVVSNLERAGWVRRERDPSDHRFVTVRLTDQGQALISEIFPRIAAAITREMSALSSTELIDLGRLCKKLGLGTAKI
ncbi:MAG: MarR family transcriptional regulator [Opitutaceae bacterium]|nr:MarR family transcriptional regulator [Opitutaceae bacterium]